MSAEAVVFLIVLALGAVVTVNDILSNRVYRKKGPGKND